MDYIINIIFYLHVLSAGIATFYGIKLLKVKPTNYIVLLAGISFFADIINAINSYYYMELGIDLGIRYVGHYYRILELILLVLFFNHFKYDVKLKIALNVFTGFIITYFIFYETRLFQLDVNSTTIRTTSAITTIFFGMLFFKSIITKMEVPNIEHWAPLYIVSAFFIYFCGVIISFFVYTPMFNIDFETGNYLWAFHNLWLIVRNVLIIIGFYFTYKTKYKWESIRIS